MTHYIRLQSLISFFASPEISCVSLRSGRGITFVSLAFRHLNERWCEWSFNFCLCLLHIREITLSLILLIIGLNNVLSVTQLLCVKLNNDYKPIAPECHIIDVPLLNQPGGTPPPSFLGSFIIRTLVLHQRFSPFSFHKCLKVHLFHEAFLI